MAFATMNASPPRTCRMRNAPPGREKPHAKCPPLEGKNRIQNAPPGKEIHSHMRNAPPRKEIHSRMRNAPPGKEIHSRMRNAPSWKGNPPPHAKCPLPERDSLPINFMLE